MQLGNFCDPSQCICKNCQNLDSTTEASKPKAVASKENKPPIANLSAPVGSTRDVKVFIDVTNASFESTAV